MLNWTGRRFLTTTPLIMHILISDNKGILRQASARCQIFCRASQSRSVPERNIVPPREQKPACQICQGSGQKFSGHDYKTIPGQPNAGSGKTTPTEIRNKNDKRELKSDKS